MPPIYHFTHGSNLAAILVAGELRASASAETVVDVADAAIKAGRETRAVDCGPGGCVGDYVPFYFAPRSPMLFRIQSGGVDGVDSDPRGLVYFQTTTEAVIEAGLTFVCTDGNAAAAITAFYDDEELIGEVVDWPLMEARYWNNTREDGDRRRRRGAEFLVHRAVPLELIAEAGVYDASVKARVEQIVTDARSELPVTVRRGWYF